MSRLLSNSTADQLRVLLSRNGQGRMREVPGPRDLGGQGETLAYPWKCAKTAAMKVTISPGEVELGPDTVVAWTSIKDADTSAVLAAGAIEKTITAGKTDWHVVVDIDISQTPPVATMRNKAAADLTALTTAEKMIIRRKKIADITIVADVITVVYQCQLGNIDIPRAAG